MSIIVFCATTYGGSDTIITLMLVIASGMLHEWYNMTYRDIRYLLLGLIIIPLPIASIIMISMITDGKYYLLLYAITIATVDTFAMIGGKMIGGAKIAPRISPNKTISGFIAGVSCGCIATTSCATLIKYYNNICGSVFVIDIYFFIFATILCSLEQMSDLFISIFKRKFKVKHSGSLIPGHGGILDRFDGIILTAPLFLHYITKCVQI